MFEKWSRDSSCFYLTNMRECLRVPRSRDAEVIMKGHKMRLLSVRGPSPDKVLEAVPWVLSSEQWESFLWIFFKQGNHMLRSEVFQVPLLQSMHSVDWKGARASWEEAFASSLGKRWCHLGLGGWVASGGRKGLKSRELPVQGRIRWVRSQMGLRMWSTWLHRGIGTHHQRRSNQAILYWQQRVSSGY